MPFANEHECRVSDPGDFARLRRTNDTDPPQIIGIREDGTSAVQAYRYPKSAWSVERARGHSRKHRGEFEPAAEVRDEASNPRRIFTDKSVRAKEPDSDGEPRRLMGYAAIFDSLSEDLGGFRERIEAGAFAKSLKRGDDVRAFVEHNGGLTTLGRTSNGSVRLKEDEKGLWTEIDLPDTTAARDIYELVKRSDVSQMSFGFKTVTDEWNMQDGDEIRTLKEVDLFDVSPVAMPAYPATTVDARSKGRGVVVPSLAIDTTDALVSMDAWRKANHLASQDIRNRWKKEHLTQAKKRIKL
jgi:HK97 family phage prohead protease